MSHNIIGVCGLICSGKSYFSKLISETFGYKYLDCDSIFKTQLLQDELFKMTIQNFFKQYNIKCFLDDGKYNSKDVSKFLFDQYSGNNLKEFNAVVRTFLNPILHKEISNNSKVLIEMATLPDNPIKHLCDHVVFVYNGKHSIDHNTLFSDVYKRDPNRKYVHTMIYNQRKILDSEYFDNYVNVYDIKNDKFVSDEELINNFLQIIERN